MTQIPNPLPAWWAAFEQWRLHGGIPSERPKGLPARIPTWAWDLYRQRHPKPPPSTELGYPTPIVLFRDPGFGTPEGGPAEVAPLMAAAGVRAVAFDVLRPTSWTPFELRLHAVQIPIYSWTRIYSRSTAKLLADSTPARWPIIANIEDDDLRAAAQHLGGVNGFLSYVKEVCSPVCVVTNYFVSDLWPANHPLSHLPVMPEWFPREITDPSATLAGSLASGQKHFRTSAPLYDGRDAGPPAGGPWPRGGIGFGDDVQKWREWHT